MNDKLKNKIDKIIADEAQALPVEVLSKLNQNRNSAVDQLNSHHYFRRFWFVPAFAMALVAVVFVGDLTRHTQNKVLIMPQESSALISNLEIIENLDILEDIEFYQWLDDEELATL